MTLRAMGLVGVGVATIANLVPVIRRLGIPPQVRQPIVARVVVVVTCLHAIGAWPNECCEHEPVNGEPFVAITVVKRDPFAVLVGDFRP